MVLPDIVIGIDPGLKGGIALIDIHDVVIAADKLPTVPIKTGNKTKQELDMSAILMYINSYMLKYKPVLCVLEAVHAMPGQGVTSMFTFGMGYGMLRGILAALNLQVMLVSPVSWKAAVLADNTHDKGGAIAYCKEHYPYVSLIPKGKRKPQDGIADAICLAKYGLTSNTKTNKV